MSFAGINSLAIFLAASAGFVFGGLWYGLLSKPWMAAAKIDPSTIQSSKGAAAIFPYVVAVIAQVVMAWALAGVIGHLGPGSVTLRNGLISAAFLWLGFVITSLSVNHAFQMQPRVLTLIDGGHWLGVLLIQGAIIGWMGIPG